MTDAFLQFYLIKAVLIAIGMIGGIVCVVLGFKLYSKGLTEAGDAELSGLSFSFKLSRFGPGIVLAIAGVLILLAGITREFNFSDGDVFANAIEVAPTNIE